MSFGNIGDPHCVEVADKLSFCKDYRDLTQHLGKMTAIATALTVSINYAVRMVITQLEPFRCPRAHSPLRLRHREGDIERERE